MLKPAPRETFHSFLSRVASSKGVSAPEFVTDIGAAWRGAVKLEQSAVIRVTEALGLTEDELAETLSWTGVPQGNVRIRFRGEDYISRSLRNPVMRGCPCCLRQVLESSPDGYRCSAVMRGDWQLREASICLEHRQLLVPIWEENTATRRFDIARQVEGRVRVIIDGSLEQPKVTPTAYDQWLDRRLESGSDEGWLADKSLHAASTVAGLLGRQILRHEGLTELDSVVALRKGQEAGYEVLSVGPDAIRSCFDELARDAKGPAAAFGVMLARFKDLYVTERSFQPFTDLLREFMAHRWPSRHERIILGEPVAASGSASSRDVARSIRRHPSYVRNATEALLEKSSVDDHRVGAWLSDAEMEAVLGDAQGLVAGKEMMALLGVAKHEWDALRAGGFISPRIHSAKMRKVWHPDDAAELLDRLKKANSRPWAESSNLRRIAPGAAAAKLPYELVLNAVLTGKIPATIDESKTGFWGIYIGRESLVQMHEGLRKHQGVMASLG